MKTTSCSERGPAAILLRTLMAFLLCLGVFIHAQDVPTDPEDDYDYEPFTYGSTSGVIIKAYWGQNPSVTTPTTLGGLPVIAIGEGMPRARLNIGVVPEGWNPRAFCNGSATSVTVSEGVLFIGDGAFANWGMLEVQLPASLVAISGNPFLGSDKQQSDTVVTVAPGSAVFAIDPTTGALTQNGTTLVYWEKDQLLTSVVDGTLTLPSNLTEIGPFAFGENEYWDNTSQKNLCDFNIVVIPDGYTHISDCAFINCTITSLQLPETLTSVGVFIAETSLHLPAALASLSGNPVPKHGITLAAENTHFTITPAGYLLNSAGDTLYAFCPTEDHPIPGTLPDSIRTIAPFAMLGANVESLLLNDGLQVIGEGAFSECTGWSPRLNKRSALLPDSITTIQRYAFLRSDFNGALPASLNTLGDYAFGFCAALRSVSIPAGVTVIPEACFATWPDETLLSATFNEGLLSIGKNAFNGSDISQVTLPASLVSLDPTAFSGFANWNHISPLKAYDIAPGNTHLKVVDGVLFSADGKTLIAWPQSKYPDYRIPDGTQTIGPLAFANSYLTGFNDYQPSQSQLIVPASVTSLYDSSFQKTGWESKNASAYFLGPAPTMNETDAQGGPMIMHYSSDHQASWTAQLDEEEGTYGPYTVKMLNGAIVIPTLVRQDGISGENEPFFRNQLVLVAGMESTDTTSVTLRYTLNGEEPTATSLAVENGLITLTGGNAAVRIAAFRTVTREEAPCGPIVNKIFLDTAVINEALDSDQLVFTTNPHAPWMPAAATDFNDVESNVLSSFDGSLGTEGTWLQTTVTGPGLLSFWWRGDDYWGYRQFTFAIDGVPQITQSGSTATWRREYIEIGAGTHTITWNATPTNTWSDYGYYSVDQVIWTTDAASPFVYAILGEAPFQSKTLVDYLGQDSHVVIPSNDNDGLPVTVVNSTAFAFNPWVTAITFPDKYHSVGNDFSNIGLISCPNLVYLFYPGAPPVRACRVAPWVTAYYPYDYDTVNGTGTGYDSWYYFLNSYYTERALFLPIAYPATDAPLINRTLGEPNDFPHCFDGSLSVTFVSAADTTVFYTTDGSIPSADSLYANPSIITGSAQFAAQAFRQINGVYQPCSPVSRRTLVNTADFNAAVGLGPDGISFLTDGDAPWLNQTMRDSAYNDTPALVSPILRPGQSSSLFVDFTMDEAGVLGFKQYYSTYYSSDARASLTIFDANHNQVSFSKTSTSLNNNWYRHTLPLPAGDFTAVWTITIPAADTSSPRFAIDDFRAGSNRCTLTLACDPVAGGQTYADNVMGSIFNVIVGQDVYIYVQENSNYLFSKWSDNNTSTSRTVTILDPADLTTDPNLYTAQFVEAAYITTTAQPYSGGRVYYGNQKYSLGTNVTLVAYSYTGYRFNRWLDDDNDPETPAITDSRTITCSAADRDKTYTAVFNPIINVYANPRYLVANSETPYYGGGTITGSGTYDATDANTPIDVALTATPENVNYAFLGWDDNQNNVIDEGEDRNPNRNLQLIWADLSDDYYYFYTNALFAQSAIVTVDFYEDGDNNLGAIAVTDSDGNEVPLADLQAGKRFPVGTVLTLTATANAGGRLRNWLRYTWAHSQEASIAITVTGNDYENSYYADFIRVIAYQASLAPDSPAGTTIVAKNWNQNTEIPLTGTFDVGQTIVVDVTPPPHYRAIWHDDVSQNTRYFVINENPDQNVFTVRFVPTYTVVLEKLPADCPGAYVGFNGWISTFDLGTESSFYATTYWNQYWRFVRWTDDNTQYNRTFNPETSGTYTFIAEFERYVRIRAFLSGNYYYYANSFTGTGDFAVTDTPRQITVTAVPAQGYRFDRWTDAAATNLADPTNPVRTISISTADGLIDLYGTFVLTHKVSVGVYPGSENFGAITQGALNNATIDNGTQITFAATPHLGAQFIKWWRNGYAYTYSTDATQTITVDRDLNFQAEFSSEADITIGIAAGQEGWGCQAGVVKDDNSLATTGTYAVGYRYTIEARPAANHRFVSWSDGYSYPSRSMALTDAGIALTATFAQTATVTLDFSTNPALLPDGITAPYMYYRFGTGYQTWFRPDNPLANVRTLDVGTYDVYYAVYGDWIAPATESITLNVGDALTLSKTFNLITKGTLTGYLSPSEIAGAWRIKGTADWLPSNSSLSIEAGDYTIEFQAVVGWLTPVDRQVTVIANRSVSFTGSYSAVVPGVQLSFSPTEVSEATGPNATIATLRRVALDGNPIDLTKPLTVYLSPSEAQALLLPANSILIPAGREFTQFPVGVIDNATLEDFLLDENQNPLSRGRLITLAGTVAMSSSCNCNGKPTDGLGERPIAADLILWDNDGPALSVVLSPSTLPERDELYPQTLTITRNDEVPTGDLVMQISAYVSGVTTPDDGTEIQFWTDGARLPYLTANDPTVSLATIPDGQRSVKVDVLACNDGKVDGNQVISVFADTANYAPGSGWVMVSDLSFPDYSIKDLVSPTQALESDSIHPLQFTLFNGGNMDAPIGLQVPVTVHASRTNSTSNNTLLLSSHIVVSNDHPLPKNGSIVALINVPLDNLAPANDWRFCVIANPNGALREVSTFNNQTWSGQFSIDASYNPQLDPIAEGTWILPNDSLELKGTVTKSATNATPVAGVDLDVYVVIGDYRRVIPATSDANGAFSVSYTPTQAERGHVIAGACYPGTDTKAKQQEFDVLAFAYRAGGNSYIFWNVTTDTPSNFSLTISNPTATALTGIQASLALPDPALKQPIPDLATITSSFPDLPDTLAGGESVVINYSITTTQATPGRDYQRPLLRFTSTEGAVLDIPVYFFAIPQFAKLSVNPVSIDTTMQIGVSRLVDVTISNTGAIESGPITISAPTLSWLSIASGSTMTSIPAGGSATMSLQLRGDANTTLGMPLSGAIAINAANAQDGVRLPFRATAVSEDKGSIRVSAVDEYTYFEEGNEPRVKNASVTVKNPYTGAILGTGNTGEDAFCVITNIPVGKTQVVISADKHESATELVDIAPGQEAKVELFLSFQAISYKWDVVPTEIEDEYEVVLTVVYETNVPMPVVRTDMPTNFIDMLPGTTRLVNAVLTNEGLIAAHNVRLDFYNAGSFTFECTQPDDGQTLLPQQAVVLPVIVRRAATSTRADDPCTTASVTVYYYECGKDFKWHRYEKQIQLRICPPASWGGSPGGGGGFSPGVPYIGSASFTQPTFPSLPSLPESCLPCQNGLLNSALKCGLGFLPIGCVLGVVDAIVSLVSNYDQGVEGWVNIGTDGTLAALGCVADGTYGKFANILGCIKGFLSACDGLDGKPPTPFPVPGLGDGFTPSGTRGGTRATGAPSWVEEAQDIAFIGYRQAGHHAAALIEYYGDDIWLEAENAQLSAFNNVFKQMTIAGPDGIAPVIAENAPELIAVLPDNVTLEDLAAFVARWNRTMAYWQSLPGGPDAELPGDTDDYGDPIISLAKLLGINIEIEQCEEDARNAGYENVHELVRAQYAYTEEQSKNSPSVCAKVTLEIKQKITMTREAFDGTLTMTNGHETLPITALGLKVKVTNAAGEDCTDLFEVLTLTDKFNGITAIDGTGSIAAKATGSAMVRFIPERGAAPETPVVYDFGGTLTYINPFSGATATIELTPSTLTVNPSPSLQIHYFLQRDVLGDDPLTRTIIEPSFPAELSALVYNDGYGIAKNFRIDSGQPKIIDNDKGLLIEFALWDYNTEASMLNGQPNNAPLGQVNLGNIQAKTTGLAQWWLTSSLLGHFIDMEAKYSHLNSNGNPELSLIESVDIHELIRSGKALDRDTAIFLVNDFVDGADMPDTVWFQDNAQSAEVLTSNHSLLSGPTFNLNADPATVTFEIEALQTGWHYLAMLDPANVGSLPGERRYEVASTTRNDIPTRADITLPSRNCWQTDRTIPDGKDPINENKLHLMDYLSAGVYTYTVTLTKLPDAAVRVTQFAAFSSNNENVSNYIVAGDIDDVTVMFNTKIDPATFTTDDMTLRRQGVLLTPAELAAELTITADPEDEFELSYVISGLAAFTSQNGFFVLTVQCAGIADPEGFFGAVGKQLMWVRQHDFGGNNGAAPSLYSMERIVPEAGMDGEFDVKLSFMGNVDPETVTTTGLRLKKNGQVVVLPAGVTIEQDPVNLGEFFIRGLGVLPAIVDFYSLRFDASGVKDVLGTSGTGLRSIAWGNDVTPPAAIANLTLTPDTGLSATDRVTQLAAEDDLTLAGTLPERPCSYQLFVVATDSEVRTAIDDVVFVPEEGNTAMSIAFNLPEGAYTLILQLKDEAGNSTEQELSLLIDNTAPLPIINSGIDPDTGDNASDRITQLALAGTLTFNAQVSEIPSRMNVSCVQRDTRAATDLGGTLTFAANADPAFHFSATGIGEGRYVITAVTTDLAGNSTSEELPFLIDNTAPTFASFTMTPDSGNAGNDFVSQSNTFAFRIQSSEVPVTILIDLNGSAQTPATLDAVTYHTFTVDLVEGNHVIAVTLRDPAGNTTARQQNVLIDNTAPAAITGLTITPDTSTADDFITKLAADAQLTLSGTLPEKLLTVTVAEGATLLATKTCVADDQAFALAFPLDEGTHALVITTTDRAGNSTVLNQTVVIDNTAPTAAASLGITPDYGAAGDFISQLAAGTDIGLVGTLPEKLLTVTVREGATVLATKTCAGDDQAFALAFPLTEGSHNLVVTTTDLAGNSMDLNQTVVIDNTAPAIMADLDIAPDTGRSDSDLVTSPNMPPLGMFLRAETREFGVAPPLSLTGILPEKGLKAEWFRKADDQSLVSLGNRQFTQDDDTAFSEVLPELPDGVYTFIVRLSDTAANSSDNELAHVVIDATAPAATTDLDIAPDTGAAGDFLTQLSADAQLTFSGTLPEKLLTVTVAEGATVLATETCADDDQAFALAFPLAEGTHELAITTSDVAGNRTTLEQTVVIDNTTPAAIIGLDFTPDLGRSADDFITYLPDGATQTLYGNLPEKLLTVTISEGETVLATKTCVGDDQAFALVVALTEGTHALTITTTDLAGNSTALEQTVVIDNTAPAATTALAIAPDSGAAGDFLSQLAANAQLTLSGNLPEKLLTITIAEGQVILGTKTCAGDDQAFAMAFPLAEGNHALSITTTDVAGNSTALTQTVVIDNTAPAATTGLAIAPDSAAVGDFITQLPWGSGGLFLPSLPPQLPSQMARGESRFAQLATGADLTLSGTLPEKLLTVTVAEGETVLAAKVCTGDDQAFALAFPLTEGTHALSITTTDQAGNSTVLNQTVVIDNTAPTAITGLNIAPDRGTPSDFITHIQPAEYITIGGNLPEKLIKVTVTEGTTVLGEKLCQGDEQAFGIALLFTQGSHDLTITTTDQAGNSTVLNQTVVIDNTSPGAAASLAMTPDTGIAGDFITQLATNAQLTLGGTLPEKLLTVTVAEGETVLATKTCAGDDQAFALPFLITEGTHSLAITTTDVAGNHTVLNQTVVIDNTAPTAANALAIIPDHGLSATDGITWLAATENLALALTVPETPVRIDLAYRAQGSQTLINLNTTNLPAEEPGPLQASIPVALRDGGNYTLVLTLSDLAGNMSSEATLPLTIDTTPLTVTVSDMPVKPGDADYITFGFGEDNITFTFSEDIVDGEFTLANIALSFAGQPCPLFALTRVDAKTYVLVEILELVNDDGDFNLTITLDGLHKALSGLPGAGTHQEIWSFAFDNPGYVWQPGWNAIFLPFDEITPSTTAGLTAMPRFLLSNAATIKTNAIPLGTALWVFCADPANAPELRGVYAQAAPLTIPTTNQWVFTGPFMDIEELPENIIAWQWQNGKYLQTRTLKLGQAFWLYSEE